MLNKQLRTNDEVLLFIDPQIKKALEHFELNKNRIVNIDRFNQDKYALYAMFNKHIVDIRTKYSIGQFNRAQRRTTQGFKLMSEYKKTLGQLQKDFNKALLDLLNRQTFSHIVDEHDDTVTNVDFGPHERTPPPQVAEPARCPMPQISIGKKHG